MREKHIYLIESLNEVGVRRRSPNLDDLKSEPLLLTFSRVSRSRAQPHHQQEEDDDDDDQKLRHKERKMKARETEGESPLMAYYIYIILFYLWIFF